MRLNRRIQIIVLVSAAVLAVMVFQGRFYLGRWSETADSGIARAYGNPQKFAPEFLPCGDWVVYVEGATGFEDDLGRWLRDKISAAYSSEGRVQLVEAISLGPEVAHRLHVKVDPDSLWTPLYATYSDSIDIKYSNVTMTGWPASSMGVGVMNPGELRIRGQISAAGKTFGLIGRPYLAEHRAKVLADLIVNAISQSYEEVKAAAMKAESH